ncbi:MAG: response regulator [Pseudomonadota bacterium]
MKSRIPLCFYPTQIIFVDDHTEFLSTLAMAFSQHFNVKVFDDPQVALAYINEQQRTQHLVEADEKPEAHGESDKWVQQVLTRPNLKRFDEMRKMEISVLVVDYSMPAMNGIEFCEQIKNSAIKKILLTGYATPMDAVKAFNDNTIHYYLRKSDENMLDLLENTIHQMQYAYFNELSSSIKAEAIDSGTPFFADVKLAQYFQSVCDSLDVGEYYYLTSPSRFALLSRDGSKSLCIIYTEEDIEEHLKILVEEDAPEELYNKIASREFIPLFNSEDGFYEPERGDTNVHIYPAQKVSGKINYYCAIISEHEANVDFKIPIVSSGKMH